MFTRYRTKAVFLKKSDLKEADQLFSFYTEKFGKVDLLGKGIRKINSKLRAGVRPFNISEIEFIQGKAYKILTDAVLLKRLTPKEGSLYYGLKINFYISQLVNKFIIDRETDRKIWILLVESLEALERSKSILEFKLIYYFFFWNFVSILGYQPGLYYCSVCHKRLSEENIYFSPQKFGLVCSSCAKDKKKKNGVNKNKNNKDYEIPISIESVKALRLFLKRDLDFILRLKLPEDFVAEIEKISNLYYKELESVF